MKYSDFNFSRLGVWVRVYLLYIQALITSNRKEGKAI